MTARQILSTATEWTFRTAAVREARAGVGSLGGARDRALRQARLVLEVASRVRYPAGRLPKGTRPAVLVGLYRDAVYWGLAARLPGDGAPPPDLHTLWAAQDPDALAPVAGDPAALAEVERLLFETPTARALDINTAEADRVGAFAAALVGDLDEARRRTNRLLTQRWLRVLLIVAVLCGVGVGIRRLLLGADLASNVKVRVSSTYSSCSGDPICNAMFFHTEAESNPWAELDLGAPKKIRTIEITNRADCCTDRSVPLVVEISTDRKTWTTLARRETNFATWEPSFTPRVARYVKLSVPRYTTFHLQDVVIR